MIFFPFANHAKIALEIENKKYSMQIDLGSSHPIDLQMHSLRKIKRKKNTEISNYIGIRGKAYPVQGFHLPEVKLSHLIIKGVSAFEENLDFIQDAQLSSSPTLWHRYKNRLREWFFDGRIGWTLFQEGVVCFNFPCSTMIIAKDLASLINQANCSLEDFIQLPFELEPWGIVITAETDLGSQKFLLDTGATHSIIRESHLKKDSSTEDFISSKLRIGDSNFGNWKFIPFDYNNKVTCDGILGIDFFKAHAVCLDFQTQTVYLKATCNRFSQLLHSKI